MIQIFFLKVITGEKKYLPINFNISYKLKYFKKGETLSKKYIISKMIGNPVYGLYTPDNVNVEKLSRGFLLTLVAYIDPNLYKSFYSIYKEQTTERRLNKWTNYTIDIKPDILSKVRQFVPTEDNQTGNKSFKLTKNHTVNDTFKKVDTVNLNTRTNRQQMNYINIKLNPNPNKLDNLIK